MRIPIFYDERQSVDGVVSSSPSAGKPARFVKLMAHYGLGPDAIGRVVPVSRNDLYLVHAKEYVDGVFDGSIRNGFRNLDPRVPESCLWTIGSLLAAARCAQVDPWIPACSPTSGFHHALYDEGEGYCTFNGLMVVAALLIQEDPSARVAILDLDFHFGNGTEDILQHRPELAANVKNFTSGKFFNPEDDAAEFFMWLEESIAEINAFDPAVVLYQAGADMHKDDPLGGILDDAQMRQRDRTVFRKVRAPIAWNLAGGYRGGPSIYEDPVLQTHRATLNEADESIGTRSKRSL